MRRLSLVPTVRFLWARKWKWHYRNRARAGRSGSERDLAVPKSRPSTGEKRAHTGASIVLGF